VRGVPRYRANRRFIVPPDDQSLPPPASARPTLTLTPSACSLLATRYSLLLPPPTSDLRPPTSERDDCEARFWLEPLALARNYGFATHELNRLMALVAEHRQLLLSAWRETHG
jgi:hypothetical protein